VFSDPSLLAVCGLSFAFLAVFFQSFVGLPIDVRAHGLSGVAFGALIAINGLLIVFLQPAAGELTRYRSRYLTLAVASLLLGAGLGMNAWVGSFGGYAVCVTIWTFGEILFLPVSQSLVAELAPPYLRGAYQGAFAFASSGAFAAAPALGGYLVGHAGARSLWLACFVTSMGVAGGFWLLAASDTRVRVVQRRRLPPRV